MDVKKAILIISLILLFFSFTNSFASAQGSNDPCGYKQCTGLKKGEKINQCCPIPYGEKGGGLVPCGGSCCPCTFCDIFVLINNIVKLLLFQIIPILAALLIAVGGVMMIWSYSGGGGTENLSKAKSLFTSVIVGLLIIYCAWLIVNFFFAALGVTQWGGLKEWWTVECGTPSSSSDSNQDPPYDYTEDWNYPQD